MPIIRSLLDTDLYKFTMWQALLHRHPSVQSEYTFVSRKPPQMPLARLAGAVNDELDALCALRFSEEELAWLGGLRFIRSDFVDFLRLFQFQRRFISCEARGDELEIRVRGPQVHVMAFEVYVLAHRERTAFRPAPG